jgi:type VI secretion system protein VasJ
MPFSIPELAPLGTSPISPDRPGGESVVYEPEFEAIKAEIEKIDSVKGDVPDFHKLVGLGTAILATKSKDLTVSGYLALGLFRTSGFPGLADGLTVCRDIVANFWDQLYPEPARMRGRVAAMTWINDRLGGAIPKVTPTASEHEAVKAVLEAYKALNETVAEKFGNDAPSFGDLRRAIDDAVRMSTPEAAPAAAAPAASGGTAPAAGPATIDSPDAAYRVFRNAGTEIRRAAEYLIKQDPSSPVPYLAQRGAAWAPIRELPQDKDGITQFNPPDSNVAANWEKLMETGEWLALLNDTEWRLTASPFWLDINYYVALALENLGHDAAAQAVTDQTAALVKRFPKLLDLMYSDGRPFAQPATRQWIQAEMSSGGGGGGTGGDVSAPVEADPVEEASREARGMAARGKLNEAVEMLQGRISESGMPRERFRWRLLLARILADGNQPAVAAAQLRLLDEDIEAHRLEAWEPGLALDALVSLYRCEKKLGQNGAAPGRDGLSRLDSLYNRLCRLDVLTALSLDSKK